jgi:hypothetical protein
MDAFKWSKTAASNNSAVPDGAPEGWSGADVNNWGREVMASVRTHISDAAYIDETYQLTAVGTKSLTRNSTTQFTISSCDATAHFTSGRRIRIVGTTTDYGFVVSSTFSSPDTIVTVTMDSGDVPSAPTQALVHVDAQIRGAAYYKTGSGNSLDADKVDGYQAADLYGPALFAEALINGSMLVWQRGTSSTSCSVGSRTFRADRWFTNPAGAAVTAARTTSTPTGATTPYALIVTGATSTTTATIAGQRIESYLMPYIKTTVTISALVKNNTGASLTLSLLLGTPAAADDFTTVTNRLTQTLTAVADSASQRLSHTVDISGYTNIDNGLQVEFQSPSGALDSGSKSITITEIQIDRASTFSFFRLRDFQSELVRCKRYYVKTFAYSTAPAQNAGVANCIIAFPDNSANYLRHQWMHGEMRTTPTVTLYNPSAANANFRKLSAGTDYTANVNTPGASASLIGGSGAVTVDYYQIHATADAEL